MGPRLSTCLITGGFGFLGRGVLRRMRPRFDRIVVCSPWSDSAMVEELDLTLCQSDLMDRGEVEGIFGRENPEMVIHLASIVTAERRSRGFEHVMENNSRPLMNILAVSIGATSLRRIINFGSGEEYGLASPPFGPLTRERPQSPYALAKLFCTHLSTFFADQAGVPVVTVRPTLAYGPGQDRSKFVPYVIGRALRSETIQMTRGEQRRDLLFSEDVAHAVETIAFHPSLIRGAVLNLASGHEMSLIEVVRHILAATGSSSMIENSLPYRTNEMMDLSCDRSAILEILGDDFPWTPFQRGMDRTIDYFREDLHA